MFEVFPVLLASAVLGLFAYGVTMGFAIGPEAMLISGFKAPFAAGAAWAITVPSFYILRSAAGSKLDASTTALAALITCSFGALAMLAAVPVSWFFALVLPWPSLMVVVHLSVFGAVGIAMTDVFLRTMRAIDKDMSSALSWFWLTLISLIGSELMLLLGLFSGGAR